MESQNKECKNCGQNYRLEKADFDMYEMLSVDPPTLCHECRQQRRLSWRNERWMFRRKCDFSGKDIISMYPPDSPFKIYEQEIWWSDKWDAKDYGRDFDFNRPFFEQFRELQLEVPRVALVNKRSENSEFTNHSADNKNSFLSATIFDCEDCYYTDWAMKSKDCVDSSYVVENGQWVYESYYVSNSNQVAFCDFIKQSYDCFFCFDCFSCKNCFMSWNLRNKQYCIRNKQYSKEDYESEIKKLFPLAHSNLVELRKEYINIKEEKAIRPATYVVNTERSVGDLLFGTKNCYFSFDCIRVEDCRYIYDAIDVKDSIDIYHVGWAELMYECHAISNAYNCRFCHFTYDNKNCTYCDCTQNSRDLFGCCGMNQAQYCILNKQYTKEEYEELVPRIVEHMKKMSSSGGSSKEWSEFFPITFSPFAYNQSRAQEYYPLTRESAEAKGYRWSEYRPSIPEVQKSIDAKDLPEVIEDVDDSILEEAVICEVSKQPFRIVKQELRFYRKFGLPLPHKHPDQRYLDRMAQRVPRKLWKRECLNCKKEVLGSFEPDSKAKMYCRECYLKEVY